MDNHPSQQEIDRVLRLKRKQRETKACYPCRQRKVKCDGSQPCRTCQKRNHPHICTYDLPARSGRSNATRGTNHTEPVVHPDGNWRAASVQSISSPGPQLQPQSQSESILNNPSQQPSSDGMDKEYIFAGDNSVVSILRLRTQDANGSMAHELGSVLGLQNTYNSYPFMDSRTPQERWAALLQILPQRNEVLKYFHFYRTSAYPFNPILVDIDRFESDLCGYLNALAAGELRDANCVSDRWATDKSIGHISLLLATLASGVHFSDIEHPHRSELGQEFARRSFQALRLANFLFRPSMDIIQSLLILGNTLQNNGQSDAAWALLGTTVRLAQTLGLHTEKSISHWPDCVKSKAKTLWFTIVWQDSLLCLCYDRPPVVSTKGWRPDATISSRFGLSYTDIMHYICRLGIETILSEEFESNGISRSLDALATLDSVYGRAQPHLIAQENCRTLHQNLEHLALKMHLSLAVSVLCRPAIKQSQLRDAQYDVLRTRAKGSLIDASKAFLNFQTLSIVPLRTWSMVHTVLSSTLLLCLWEETRNDPECFELQQRVIEVFSTTEVGASESNSTTPNGQWLSERHIRALVTLRNAVRSALDQQREDLTDTTQPNLEPYPMFGIPNTLMEGDPFGVSPISYLDSIMNIPMFDLSQETGFP
ncbi:hypothetical protein AWENTII_011156 [Aspergillus wentii]